MAKDFFKKYTDMLEKHSVEYHEDVAIEIITEEEKQCEDSPFICTNIEHNHIDPS